jgi:two-component system chemotaxis response regulator CheB
MTVDDCAVARHVVKLLLDDQRDVEVIAEAASFNEARAMLADRPVDVITLDLNLPGETGLSVMERLRSSVRGIIIISGNNSQHAEALRRGAVACMEKSTILAEKMKLVQSIHRAALQ